MDTPSEITSATRSMPAQLQKISALPPVTLLLVLGQASTQGHVYMTKAALARSARTADAVTNFAKCARDL